MFLQGFLEVYKLFSFYLNRVFKGFSHFFGIDLILVLLFW